MKVEELMIGDWVQFADGNKKCMVVGIKCDARYLTDEATITVMDSSGDWFDKTIDELKPIPLTPEILEKNGFVYNDLPFVQAWEQYGLSIYGDGLINCGQNVSLKCQYVHHLQHILRACGIEKEIIL